MIHLNSGLTTKDFEGYTVLIPSYSVVNSAQLALDALISSLQMQRVGFITDKSLVPIFGHSAFQHNPDERAASCEIYADTNKKLLVIQLRTLVILETAGPFHKKLVELLKEANVERAIIMSTSVQHGPEDLPLQYYASESFKNAYKTDLETVKWGEIEETATTEIVGGGNDKLLFKIFEMYGIPAMIYYRFVGLPTDAVQEKVLFHLVNDLVVTFLKVCDKFKLILPIGFHSSVGHEMEMMY